MKLFEFLRKQGKDPQTLVQDQKEAAELLGKMGFALFSIAGVSTFSEIAVYWGVIDWERVRTLGVTDFYCWPERARWLAVLSFLTVLGVFLYALHAWILKKLTNT